MELVDNKVWILRSEEDSDYHSDYFIEVFSSKEYAEDGKKLAIEKWEKSITKDSIPRRLNNRSEIKENTEDYPEVIRVNKDHYSLVKGWGNTKEGNVAYWYYNLMSNAEWDDYYQRYISHFVIEDHVIVK